MTAISSRAALWLTAVTIVLAGCGAAQRRVAATPFGWLHPQAQPAGWPVAAISSGATIAYPSGWRRLTGDRGTASAALLDARGGYLGYLNLTPRQGHETLGDWARFRVAHNADEGDVKVTTLAVTQTSAFPAARGRCVKDGYTTKTGARFIELACLVIGRSSSVVVVGAAPPAQWARRAPVLQRAIASVKL